jgi:hypothetical protein
MKCFNCGKENSDDSKFCVECGASFNIEDEEYKSIVEADFKKPLFNLMFIIKGIQVLFAFINIFFTYLINWDTSKKASLISLIYTTSLPIVLIFSFVLLFIPFAVGLITIDRWSKEKEELSTENKVFLVIIYILNIIPFTYLLIKMF